MRALILNLLKRLPMIAMVMLLALVVAPALGHAQDSGDEDPGRVADVMDAEVDGDDEGDDEKSTFQNPAQAQKAENLAREATRNTDDEELAERVEKAENAEQELAEARERLANLPEDATEEERREAIRDVRQARRDVREARRAVAERLSEISGEYKEDITRMREEGYGWGQIAHELGVHPSALGLGHKYGHKKSDRHNVQSRHRTGKRDRVSAATARDVKTGWGARGHGVSAGGKASGKGQQSDRSGGVGKSSAGKGKGNSKGGGEGTGRGGGRGGGKGGGKGGGNGKN